MKTPLTLLLALTCSVSFIRTQTELTVSSITTTPTVSSLPGETTPPTFALSGATWNATPTPAPTTEPTPAPTVPPGFTIADAASTVLRSSVAITTASNSTTEPGWSPNSVPLNTTPGTASASVSSDPSMTTTTNQSSTHTAATTPPAATPGASCSQAVPGWAIALLVLVAVVLLLLLLLLLALLLRWGCRRRKKGYLHFEQQNQPVIPLYNTHRHLDQNTGGVQDGLEKASATGSYTVTQQ